MEIKTERLLLRPLGRGDLYTTHAYLGDVENTLYMAHMPNRTLAQTGQFLAEADAEWARRAPAAYEFAITLNGHHIGAISLRLDAGRRQGEFGWILHRDYWRNGYALEAALAVKHFAADVLGVEKLTATCDSRNTASAKLMEKIGMVRLPGERPRQYPDARGASGEYAYSLDIGEASAGE